jgi:signal transduction histidine kinase
VTPSLPPEYADPAADAPARQASGAEALLRQLPGQVAVVGSSGDILSVNANWRRFATPAGPAVAITDFNYLRVCDSARGDDSGYARAAAAGVRAVLDGAEHEFSLEYPCHSAVEQRWFRMQVVPVQWHGEGAALVLHHDVTAEVLYADELARSRALLEQAQALAGIASVVYDHAGDSVTSTHATMVLLGLQRPPLKGADLVATLAPSSRRALLAALSPGAAGQPIELELEVLEPGATRWLRAVRGGVPTGEPTPRASTVVLQDITAMRQARVEVLRLNASLERRVLRRTRQLESANRELEAFSYSVSHDLKAPLAAVDGFTHVLSELLKGRLDEREAGYMHRVRGAVADMFGLIEAMLGLHRLARNTRIDRTRMDLSPLAESIVDELREQDPARPCRISIERAIVVYADPTLIGVVLRNLIGNAWKFSSRKERTELVVAIDGAGPPGYTTLSIADNGAGFDPRHAQKLFAPFQRLHHSDDFPGTGVGLATVQRIVQRHGGLIRAEATPGAGATFWISLPQSPPDSNDTTGAD